MITPSQVNLYFNGTLTNVIQVSPDTVIVYDTLSVIDKNRWSYFGELYGSTHPLTAPVPAKTEILVTGAVLTSSTNLPVDNVPGFQIVDFGGTASATGATGLVAGTIYTATVDIDGTVFTLSIDGANAGTFGDLVNAINTTIGTAGTASITTSGNLEIRSSTAGSTSYVSITDTDLFSSITGFIGIDPATPGVNNTVFTFAVDVSGTPTSVTIDGDVAQTFNQLLTELQNALSGVVNVTAVDDTAANTITFTFEPAAQVASGDTITITDANVFTSTGYTVEVDINKRKGAIDTIDAMKQTPIPEIPSYSFYDLYHYLFVPLQPKPSTQTWFPNNSTVYWDGTTWRRVVDDTPI